MASKHNAFLEASASEESGSDQGYDSEAAERSKGHRSTHHSEHAPKRRRLSGVESVSEAGDDIPAINDDDPIRTIQAASSTAVNVTKSPTNEPAITGGTIPTKAIAIVRPKDKPKKKKKTPGVIYLSSIPPYLRPSALRNLLTQRGFSPIARLFLAPASKHTRGPKSQSTSTKSSKRQLYSEGWVEFASKSTAKRCAETLNAAPVGGKKGGFYRDDIWNMKYLRGMRWDELMAGVREERREEEGRRDEERLVLARETKRFVEGVERGRKMKGIEGSRAKKKKRYGEDDDDDGDDPEVEAAGEVKRTWRQFEVKGKPRENPENSAAVSDEPVSEDVKRVLGKIF